MQTKKPSARECRGLIWGGRSNVLLHTDKPVHMPKGEAFDSASISTGDACRRWKFKPPELCVNSNSYRPTDVDPMNRRAALVAFYPIPEGHPMQFKMEAQYASTHH
jgi:hypothetical protein